MVGGYRLVSGAYGVVKMTDLVLVFSQKGPPRFLTDGMTESGLASVYSVYGV